MDCLLSHEDWTLYTHHICVQSDNFIFKCPEFEVLTCFQSAHHPLAEGIVDL